MVFCVLFNPHFLKFQNNFCSSDNEPLNQNDIRANLIRWKRRHVGRHGRLSNHPARNTVGCWKESVKNRKKMGVFTLWQVSHTRGTKSTTTRLHAVYPFCIAAALGSYVSVIPAWQRRSHKVSHSAEENKPLNPNMTWNVSTAKTGP